jgi:ABC-2 type transport system ATP-binding protein
MEEVARICDEVIFLNRGEIVTRGAPKELARQIPDAELELAFVNGHAAVAGYLEVHGHRFLSPAEHQFVITTQERAIPGIIAGINGLGAEIVDIDLRKPDLEDVFLQIARNGDVVQAG